MSAKIIAVVNQKGGIGKTTTCVSLGIGMARAGKKVLLVDVDPQGSLAISLGFPDPNDISISMATIMGKILNESPVQSNEGILNHVEGVDLLPSNEELAAMEVYLVTAMSRETVLKRYLDQKKESYDYILLDCMPALGVLTINALVAADSVLIPVETEYLSAKGLERLLETIAKVRKGINPALNIDGILLTKVNGRTNNAKEIAALVEETYGENIRIFNNNIPMSVRVAETSTKGCSIYLHDPKGKVAAAYEALTLEVMNIDAT